MTSEAQTRVSIALAQSKKLERDARALKQTLAALQENLQGDRPQGEHNGNRINQGQG